MLARESIKVAANTRDVPYPSLIKVWLQEKAHTRWVLRVSGSVRL